MVVERDDERERARGHLGRLDILAASGVPSWQHPCTAPMETVVRLQRAYTSVDGSETGAYQA